MSTIPRKRANLSELPDEFVVFRVGNMPWRVRKAGEDRWQTWMRDIDLPSKWQPYNNVGDATALRWFRESHHVATFVDEVTQ